jgi:hypothetical protein
MNQIADEPVRAAFDKLKTLSADTEARRLAFVRERALHDEASLLKDARDEGREEGRKEGLEIGWDQGQAAALRQTATNLIRATALDDAAIAAITGLEVAEIGALREGSA